jgi:dynein heavy chain 1
MRPPLIEAISQDFNHQRLRVLISHRLPYTPYEIFTSPKPPTSSERGMTSSREFTNIVREVTKKMQEKFIPINMVRVHAKLQERTRYWREQHEQLAVITGLRRGLEWWRWMDMEEVKEAYEVIKRIDVLDIFCW